MNDPTHRTLSDLIADLEASEAELAAGDLVPGEVVLAELRESIARLEAKQRIDGPRRAMPRR
jgi:hypothetical protein